jgi:hypothetical protein
MLRNSIRKTSSSNVISFDEKKINIFSPKKEKERDNEKDKDKEKENNLKIKLRPDSPLHMRREKKSLTSTNKLTYNTYNKDNNLVLLPYYKNNNINHTPSNSITNSGELFRNHPLRKKSTNIFKENFKSCNKNLPIIKTRKDSFGILILKGSKNHSIIFKDKLNEEFNLVEIIDVESYKEENIQNEYEYTEDGEEESSEVINLGLLK